MTDLDNTTRDTVLLVDDVEANIDIVLGILDDFDVIPATSARDALDVLAAEDVDLILLDIMMPGMDGFELCALIDRDARLHDIPVIFLTARDDEDSIERAYAAGGCDYVTKPFKPGELLARVRFHLKYRQMFKELAFLATRDPLTGVLNRRRFFELATARFAADGEACFAMMIDVDRFKEINDTFGHAAGDEALRYIAERIRAALPEDAVVGRIGGEEFAVLLSATTLEETAAMAERLCAGVADGVVRASEGRTIRCTVSTGLAERTAHTDTLDQLLSVADAALYEAKSQGRNRAIFRDRGRDGT
jgi:diguanylate cyclase (GGDEF)-like protein